MDYTDSGLAPIGWLTLAFINAGLAESKNRSRLQWFLVSLVLGPLATALIVVWPRGTVSERSGLHPARRASDRYVLLLSASLAAFVLSAAIAVAVFGAPKGFPVAIGVVVLSAIGIVFGARGYNRSRSRD